MLAVGLDHLNFRVPSHLLVPMKSFYCDIVGLYEGARPDFGTVGYWLYAQGQPVIHLSCLKNADLFDPLAKSAFDHVAFRCLDADAALQALTEQGVQFTLRHFPLEGLSQIFMRDPAGNTVELNCPLSASHQDQA